MSALLSFLGGSAFRAIWGELASFLEKRQEHRYEVERMKLQGEQDAAQHARNMTAIKTQADLGVKTIEVQRDSDLARSDADAWGRAVGDVGKTTGVKFLDAWNGSIRPLLATAAVAILVQELVANGGTPTPHVLIICDAVLGIYVADRSLGKRGK